MANIRKRGNSYEITVSCGYDTNGKKIRRSTTYKPDKGMTQKQIEKEVNRQAVLFEEQCKYGRAAADGKIKFDEYVKQYLENAKNTLSEYEQRHYKRIIELHISPVIGHMKLKDITPVHIQHLVNELQEKPAKTKTEHYAPATVRRYFTILQSIFHSAYKLGIIGINPTDGDRITLPRLQEQTTDIFTRDELKTIFGYLEKEPLQFKILIHLAINSGCRRGELVGLKWTDINFNTGVLTVQRSNYKVTDKE